MRTAVSLDTSVAATTMAAVSVAAPGSVRIDGVAQPRPAPGQILVRLEGCGVCGSNVPVWEGRPWFSYPLGPGEPGHEGWGRVQELGAGLTEPQPGARIAFLSNRAFTELDVVDADKIVTLPPELDDLPFPGEALGCAMNVFRRSRIAPGAKVAVVGTGFLGLLVVQLAVRAGAEVAAYSRRPFGLELAAKFGATGTHALDDRVGDGAFDRVVEAAGTQITLDLASTLVRERGLLVIAGYHQDGPRQVDLRLWNWRGIDVVNAHERRPEAYVEGMRKAVDAVLEGRLDPGPLFTHSFPLDELDAALEAARTRPDGFLKALVLM